MYDALPRDVKQSDQPKEVNPNNIDKQNEISSEISDVNDDNSKASCFESDLTEEVVRGKNLHTRSSLPYVLSELIFLFSILRSKDYVSHYCLNI